MSSAQEEELGHVFGAADGRHDFCLNSDFDSAETAIRELGARWGAVPLFMVASPSSTGARQSTVFWAPEETGVAAVQSSIEPGGALLITAGDTLLKAYAPGHWIDVVRVNGRWRADEDHDV